MPEDAGVHPVDLGPHVGAWFTGDHLDGLEDANLAHHRPHRPDALAAARDRVATLTGTDVRRWHLMRQVHGAAVAVVDESVPPGAELRDVDVAVTDLVERPLVVLAADCLPIVAAGDGVVGVGHAGWRGVVADVPGALVASFVRLGADPSTMRVAIGPGIGPCCYAVGPEVVAAVGGVEPSARTRTRDGATSVDLRAAVRARLRALGVEDVVDAGGEDGEAVCTGCRPGWFSHRRDPRAGRHAGMVVRWSSASDADAAGGGA